MLVAEILRDCRSAVDDLLEYRHEMAQAKADASAEASATREARGHLANADDNIKTDRNLAAYWLKEHGTNTMGEARRAASGPDRRLFPEAVDYAVKRGWIQRDGKKLGIGLESPES